MTVGRAEAACPSMQACMSVAPHAKRNKGNKRGRLLSGELGWLSTLLRTRQGFIRSFQAWRRTACVCTCVYVVHIVCVSTMGARAPETATDGCDCVSQAAFLSCGVSDGPCYLLRSHSQCPYVPTCVQTPSSTSTTTMAPSERRVAVDTSDEKSMCPGESIRLMR